MPERFVEHIIEFVKITWVFALFFPMWPIVFGLGCSGINTSINGKKIGFGQVMHHSIASYLGFEKETVYSYPMILHRIVGALAWAYVVAIFIASLG
jgi:hypothetical protein